MKKNLFKTSLIFSSIVLLFSSCLGDTDSSFEAKGDFAYVTTNPTDGVRYASLSNYYGMPATSPEIDGLKDGGCYFLSYKLTSSNTQGIYYIAELISKPVLIPQSDNVVVLNEGDEIPSLPDEIYSKTLAISKGYVNNVYGDRWLCLSKMLKAPGNNINIKLYFDPNNQFEDLEKKKKVGKNQIILDVVSAKQSLSGEELVVDDYSFASNMSAMRIHLENILRGNITPTAPQLEFSDQDDVLVQFRFRYKKESESSASGYDVKLYPEYAWSDNIAIYITKKELDS